jgi:hypothetical protein
MIGTRISQGFQWHWSDVKIPSESMGIMEKSGDAESVRVLRHHIVLEPVRVAFRGLAHP